MFPEPLKKILSLVKRTGDRVVIYDGSNPDESYVLMSLDNYAGLALPGEKKAPVAPVPAPAAAPSGEPETISLDEEGNDLTDEDLTDRINREISLWKNQGKASSLSEEDKVSKSWSIPPQIKDKALGVEE